MFRNQAIYNILPTYFMFRSHRICKAPDYFLLQASSMFPSSL